MLAMPSKAMNTNFAGVVDEVQELSLDEKAELKELLESYIIEERRDEILRACEEGRKEQEEGKLVFTSNVDDLMASLDD
jgi:hypothetical protein